MNKIFERTRKFRAVLLIPIFLVGALFALIHPAAKEALAQGASTLHLPLVTSGATTQGSIRDVSSQSQSTLASEPIPIPSPIYFVNAPEIPNCAPLLPQFGIAPYREVSDVSVQSVDAPQQGLVEYALVLVITDGATGNTTLCGLTTAQRPLKKAIELAHVVQQNDVAIEELVLSFESISVPTTHKFECRELGSSTDDDLIDDSRIDDGRIDENDDFSTALVAILGEEFLPGFGSRELPEITVSKPTTFLCPGGYCGGLTAQPQVLIGKFGFPPDLVLTETPDCGVIAGELNAWSDALFEGEPDETYCATRPDGSFDDGTRGSTTTDPAPIPVPSQWKVIVGACSSQEINESRTAITLFMYSR